MTANGHVHRARPEAVEVIEATVGRAPVQRVLGRVSNINHHVCHTRLFDSRRQVPFSFLMTTCHPSVKIAYYGEDEQ